VAEAAVPIRPPSSAPSSVLRESKVTVKIPRPLYRKIQQVIDGSGFNSPTDFIVYVLRDVMGEAEEHKAGELKADEQKHEFNADEIEDVKRKLKNLGYL
jgi:Arc/MetJ-type ribon-helix-helix transcriptional regulator